MATIKTPTGIRFPEETLNKLKYIAWYERTTLTDRIIGIADEDINKWEKKNGAITPDQIKKALKK